LFDLYLVENSEQSGKCGGLFSAVTVLKSKPKPRF